MWESVLVPRGLSQSLVTLWPPSRRSSLLLPVEGAYSATDQPHSRWLGSTASRSRCWRFPAAPLGCTFMWCGAGG